MEACVELLAEKEHHVAIFSAIGVLKSLLGGEDGMGYRLRLLQWKSR